MTTEKSAYIHLPHESANEIAAFLRSPIQSFNDRKYRRFFSQTKSLPFLGACLQNALHKMLGNYLNGEDYPPSRLALFTANLHPRMPVGLSAETAAIILELRKYGKITDRKSQDLLDKLTALDTSPTVYETAMPHFLVSGYAILKDLIAELPATHKDYEIPLRTIETETYHTGYFQPVTDMQTIFRQTAPPGCCLLLHGSLATLDHVPGLSDCDTLLILDTPILQDAAMLEKLRRAAVAARKHQFLIDPLQHHGHFIITTIDLQWYPQHYFPLPLFPLAKCIHNYDISPRISAVRDDLFERYTLTAMSIYYMERAMENFTQIANNAYTLKSFLQAIQITPVYLNQLTGQFADKKTAIETFPLLTKKPDTELLAKTTKMRECGNYRAYSYRRAANFLIPDINPATMHRRATLLADKSTYTQKVRQHIGTDTEIFAMTQIMRKTCLDFLMEQISQWKN